jgi:hypothetical protein
METIALYVPAASPAGDTVTGMAPNEFAGMVPAGAGIVAQQLAEVSAQVTAAV